MKKQFEEITIEYGEKSKSYIDELVDYFKKESKKILDFFDLKKLDKPLEIILWDDIEDFREYCREGEKDAFIPDWVCGTASGSTDEIYKIDVLSLEELKKARTHEKEDLESLEKLIIHEFTHDATKAFLGEKGTSIWLGEGIACSLAKQNDAKLNLDDLSKDTFSSDDNFRYVESKYLLDYLIEAKGKKYLQSLIKNPEDLYKNSEKIYFEMREFYKEKEKGNRCF